MPDPGRDPIPPLSAPPRPAADLYRLLVESVGDDALFLLDPAGRIGSWNGGAERITGYPAADAVGRPFDLLFTPEAGAATPARQILDTALTLGRVEEERAQTRRDGSACRVVCTVTALREHARHVGFAVVVRDVSDRVRAEEDLARFRALLRHAPTGIAFVDRDLRFVRVNEQLAEINGVPPEGHLGRRVGEIVPPLWPTLEPVYRRVADTGEAAADLALSGELAPAPGLVRHWRADVYPVHAADGRMLGFGVLVVETTDRRQAEDRVRESERRFRGMLENSSDVISIHDAAGVMVYQSPSVKPVLGYEPGELIGQDVFAYLHPDDQARAADEIARVKARPGVHPPFEIRFRHRSGEWRWFECTGTNLLADPAVAGILFNARDVTARRRAEDDLRRSERRYRTLVTTTSKLVWTASPAGDIVPPDEATTYSGRTPGEAAGWGWIGAVHPDDRGRAVEEWRAAVAAGQPLATEVRVRRADGAWRRIAVRVVPVRDAAGRIEEWVGVGDDVTDLRHTEAWLRAVLDSTFDAIITADEGGVIVSANAAAHRTFGYPDGELVGRAISALMPDPHQNRHPTFIADYLRTGQANIIGTVREETGRRRDGSTFPLELTVTEFRVDDARHFTGVMRDISGRRQAEWDLRLRDRAIRAASQGIIITDAGPADCPIIYASPGFERLTGYPGAEVVGRDCRFLQGKDTDPLAVAEIRAALRAARPCDVEFLNYRKDGTTFWNHLRLSPVRDDAGRPTHFVGVLTDVTGRRKLEEQLRQSQKMEAIGRLAGGVAHDFNNLLTVINGYGEVVYNALPAGHPGRAGVAEIRKAGDRAAVLTRQLLAFSRQTVLEPKVLDVNALVRDMERMLRPLIGEDVDLVTHLADVGRVRADPGQLEQAVVNLCVNARDAMPRGGKLTIETRDVDLDAAAVASHPDVRPGPYVLLSVADTGMGMAPEVQARIFEPFFTTKEVGKGTGLGLAMVFGFVKQSGGHIAVHSGPGRGAVFKLYLPRGEATPAAGGSGIIPSPLPRGTETVLLVEDEEAVRSLILYVLRSCGYTVLEAGNGQDAVRVAEAYAGPVHLLVTDVVMPGGMGGRQVAEAVCARRPESRVLFTSGYTDDAIVRHGVLEELSHFLQKPFTPAALAQKVRAVLDRPG